MTPLRHQRFSPRRIGAIASNTLLELVRLKVFYFLLLFALLIIGSSVVLVKLTFQEQFQVLKDVSLGAMSLFSWLLGVLATAAMIPKDVEDRTLYTILAKPVPRFEYLLGKLLGVLALLAVSMVLMGIMFAGALYLREQAVVGDLLRHAQPSSPETQQAIREVQAAAFNVNLLPVVVIIYLKSALLAALTLLLSTFATSSIFTIIVSVIIYFIGHLQGIAREYWMAVTGDAVLTRALLALAALVFPDLQLFNLTDDVVAGNAIPLMMFLKTSGLGVLYLTVYTTMAAFMFHGREL